MKIREWVLLGASAAALAACDGSDITLSPTTIDNSTGGSNSGGGTTSPCASYEEAGQTFAGTVDANGNCFYSASFVSDTKPITVSSLTIPNFGGLHVFADSLYVGEDVNATAAAAGKPIPQEGEGTRLNIEAGNTLVFQAADSYVRVARGSQIFAEGTAANPIIFTADEDAVLGVATESDRGLWGGIQINGNGRTNKCHDGTATGSGSGTSDFLPTANNVHNCHVTAEGRPATYGGNNNAENSGVLTYVVIKHAGFEVVDGDELNGLTLNAVGSGTTISHVQTYTTQDDGFELFGGAVNLDHIVAVNVGDDSIDYSEGYNGHVQYAVVVHTSGSNRCIEGDNTGEGRADTFTPTTKMLISNMTCVTSYIDQDQGTNPTSKGDSEGPLFREGVFFEMYNSIVTSNRVGMESNECLEVDDTEGPETIDAMQAGVSVASSNVIACTEALKVTANAWGNAAGFDTAPEGSAFQVWLDGGNGTADIPTNTNHDNVVLTGADVPAVMLIDGGVGTRGYLTTADIQNAAGGSVFNQATQLTTSASTPPLPGVFEDPTYLGGANAGDDWLAGWTVGLTQALNAGDNP